MIVRHSLGSTGILTAMDRKMACFFAKESDSQESFLLDGDWLKYGGKQRDVEWEKKIVGLRTFFYGLLVLGTGGSHVHYTGSDFREAMNGAT